MKSYCLSCISRNSITDTIPNIFPFPIFYISNTLIMKNFLQFFKSWAIIPKYAMLSIKY